MKNVLIEHLGEEPPDHIKQYMEACLYLAMFCQDGMRADHTLDELLDGITSNVRYILDCINSQSTGLN